MSIPKYLVLAFLLLLMVSTAGGVSLRGETIVIDAKELAEIILCKACIVSDDMTIWSNDGSSVNGNQPESGFPVNIEDQAISAEFGCPPMKPIFPEALRLFDQLALRVWIDYGDGFEQLQDRPVTSEDFSLFEYSDLLTHTNNTDRDVSTAIKRSTELVEQKISEKQGDVPRQHPKNPRDRAKERFLKKAGKDGEIPMDAMIKAKEHIDQMAARQQASKDAGIWSWSGLGPGTTGGRIRSILIHPTETNRMWIGSVSGGIWKTTNSGDTWQAIDDFLPNLNITSLVMDPTDSEIMYASTGEGFGNFDGLPGAGIFKSTDGGDHWFQMEATANINFRWVNRLAHHPTSADTVYAVTNADIHRLWRTTNGGETWLARWQLDTTGTDVKVHPNDPTRILIGTLGDVYYSFNNTWTFDEMTTGGTDMLPSDPGRCEVAFCPTSNDVFYVAMERGGGELWWTTDAGSTWELRNDEVDFYVGASNQGWYDNVIWVDPTDHRTLVIGGIDLWRSEDAGETFEKISAWQSYHIGLSAHADHHAIVHHPDFNGTTNTTVFFGNDGGIQKADDVYTVSEFFGWENLANELAITQFYAGASSPDGTEIYGGTQDNSTLRYKPEDGWNDWNQFTTGDGGYCAVDPDWPNVVYNEYPRLEIHKSVAWGDLPSQKINGLLDARTTNALFIAPFKLAPEAPAVLYAGAASIWKTTNGADDWSEVRTPVPGGGNPRCSAIDLLWDGEVIWVGYTNGHVAKSANGGDSWERVDTNSLSWPTDRWVADIAINPVFPDRVYVTFSEYESDNVWYTGDGGESWEKRVGTAPDTLPALPVNTITFSPVNPGRIYIGTDLGVFASGDHGQTWSTAHSYPDNEGPANVEVSDLFWNGENLVAATFGRGMYITHPRIIIYVDRLAPSGGDGSYAQPYRTITEALNAAGHGTIISIAEGTYDEAPMTISKKGKLKATLGTVIIK